MTMIHHRPSLPRRNEFTTTIKVELKFPIDPTKCSSNLVIEACIDPWKIDGETHRISSRLPSPAGISNANVC